MRAGVVPGWELDRLSVAYGSVRDEVKSALATLRTGNKPAPVFVRGEWGTGKTHLLTYVRSAASHSKIANTWVDLNARSAPLNYPQRFYPMAAETLKAGDAVGLKALVMEGLRTPGARRALFEGTGFGDLRWPMQALMRDVEENGFADYPDHWAWHSLLGADISTYDYAYKRRQATDRFEALGAISRALGLGGAVLLFDEVETLDQLWNVRSRMAAYDVLGRLCLMRNIWCVFGITERFENRILNDMTSGVNEWDPTSPEAKWFMNSWGTDRLKIVAPPSLDFKGAKELARAVAMIYEVGYPGVNKGAADHCVDEWRQDPLRNPRRLIRLLVHRLDLARGISTQPPS